MFGQSLALDLALHAGIGVAAASVLLVALMKPRFLQTPFTPTWQKNLFNLLTGLTLMGSQISIAAFLGLAEKASEGDAAILGFILGVGANLFVAWLVRPRKTEA